MALGKHLVGELKLDPGVDTLGRWIAHHIAELITKAENAPAAQKAALEKSAAEAILMLWDHRASIERIDPLRDLKPLLGVIKTLDPDENPWVYLRRERPGIVDLYSPLRRIITFTLLELAVSPKPRTGFESEDEAAILSGLDIWMSQKQKDMLVAKPKKSAKRKQGKQADKFDATETILADIERARTALDKLERQRKGLPPLAEPDPFATIVEIVPASKDE